MISSRPSRWGELDAYIFPYIMDYIFFNEPLLPTASEVKEKTIGESDVSSYLKNLRARSYRLSDYLIKSGSINKANSLIVTKSSGTTNITLSSNGPTAISKITQYPVTATWTQAVIICNLLSVQSGFDLVYSFTKGENGEITGVTADFNKNGFRLPTEAEWEFAARGGLNADKFKYSGSDNSMEVAFFNEPLERIPYPVGLKKANSLGLFDMSGNVYEWTWDFFGKYAPEALKNPQGPSTPVEAYGSNRVIRGGSWVSSEQFISVFKRSMTKAINDNGLRQVGIRLVRSINE